MLCFLGNQTNERKIKYFPLLSHIFLAPKHQANTKNVLKIMYIFREHTKIRKKLFPFAFLYFLSTQTPSKHKKNILRIKKIVFSFFWLNVFGILELCFWETKRNGEERRLWGRMATTWNEREEIKLRVSRVIYKPKTM